jgi:hypothetical protein
MSINISIILSNDTTFEETFDCSICFENLNEINLALIGCNHILCITCLSSMLNTRHKQCPLCRKQICNIWVQNNEQSNKIIKSLHK